MDDFEKLMNEVKREMDNNPENAGIAMSDNEVMGAIFDIAKKNTPKISKKQEKNEEAKNIMRERLKNAREKKKSLTDKLKELENLLKQKNEVIEKPQSPPQIKPEPQPQPQPQPVESIPEPQPQPVESIPEPQPQPPKVEPQPEPVQIIPQPQPPKVEPQPEPPKLTREELAKKQFEKHLYDRYYKSLYRSKKF